MLSGLDVSTHQRGNQEQLEQLCFELFEIALDYPSFDVNANQTKIDALCSFLESTDVIKLDFHVNINQSFFTPLWIIIFLSTKDEKTSLYKYLENESQSSTGLNERCPNGVFLWWLISLLSQQPITTDLLIEYIHDNPINLEVRTLTEEALNIDESILFAAMSLAEAGRPELLDSFMLTPEFAKLDFKSHPEQERILWVSARLCLLKVNDSLLENILPKIDFSKINPNFICKITNPEALESITLLGQACVLAKRRYDGMLKPMVAAMDVRTLDVNTQVVLDDGSKTANILLWAAYLYDFSPELLDAILDKYDISSFDLNAASETNFNRYLTLMWWALYLAKMNKPKLLITIIHKADFTKIDFNARCTTEGDAKTLVNIIAELAPILHDKDLFFKILDKMPFQSPNLLMNLLNVLEAQKSELLAKTRHFIYLKAALNALQNEDNKEEFFRLVKIAEDYRETYLQDDDFAYYHLAQLCEQVEDKEAEFAALCKVPSTSRVYNKANTMLAEFLLSEQLSAQGHAIEQPESPQDKEERLLKAVDFAFNVRDDILCKHIDMPNEVKENRRAQELRTHAAIAYVQMNEFPSSLAPDDFLAICKGDKATCIAGLKLRKENLELKSQLLKEKSILVQFKQTPVVSFAKSRVSNQPDEIQKRPLARSI